MSLNEKALKADLAKRGYESISVKRQLPSGRIEIEANKLHPLELEGGASIYAPIPVSMSVELDKRGRVQSINGGTPDSTAIAAALHHVRTLRDSGQLASGADATQSGKSAQKPAPGVTHQIESDEQGRRVLRRKRFSIV